MNNDELLQKLKYVVENKQQLRESLLQQKKEIEDALAMLGEVRQRRRRSKKDKS